MSDTLDALKGALAPEEAAPVKFRLNWSTLRYIATSARLLKWRIDHPEPESDALRKGRSIHCAILEPKKFPKRWVSVTSCHATTKGGGACRSDGSLYFEGHWYCRLRGHAPEGATDSLGGDLEILDREAARVTTLCAESVFAHGPASKILQGGRPEQEIEWTDAESGIECRGRVDYLRPNEVVDLKTTRQETVREFTADAARNMYHGQLAWYTDGAIAAGRLPQDAGLPYVVSVSTVEPYDVVAYQLSKVSFEAGRILVRDLITKYQECMATDLWPGVAPDLAVLDLPSWAAGMHGSELTERW